MLIIAAPAAEDTSIAAIRTSAAGEPSVLLSCPLIEPTPAWAASNSDRRTHIIDAYHPVAGSASQYPKRYFKHFFRISLGKISRCANWACPREEGPASDPSKCQFAMTKLLRPPDEG